MQPTDNETPPQTGQPEKRRPDKNALELFAPKIQAIQNHINLINEYYRKRTFTRMLQEMLLTISELDPVDKPKEMRENIIAEIKRLRVYKYDSQRKKRLHKKEWRYYEWSDTLQKHIWECGYFNIKKWGGPQAKKEPFFE